MGSPSHHSHPIHSMVKQRLQPSLLQRLTLNLKLHHTMDGVAMVAGAMESGLLMLKPAPTTVDTTAVITGKGLPMPTLRLPLDAMEVVADMVVVVDTGARGLLMLKPAPTMADPDTTAVITGKGLLVPTLRLPLDAMEVVVDTGARGLLMQKPAPTMADTMAVIMGKDLPMPMLRLPLDAMEVVADMVVVGDTGAENLDYSSKTVKLFSNSFRQLKTWIIVQKIGNNNHALF